MRRWRRWGWLTESSRMTGAPTCAHTCLRGDTCRWCSDVFLFGARWVYRNVFDDARPAEAYHMGRIEAHGLDRCACVPSVGHHPTPNVRARRQDLIRFALLTGSDYTPGVHGVGKVNATEILRAFPGDSGLVAFKEWVLSVEEMLSIPPQASLSVATDPISVAQREFKQAHANIKQHWVIPEGFPSPAVVEVCEHPAGVCDLGGA